MTKYVFGIDLGTTYSCISYVDETGRPVVIKNTEGTNTTPAVVNFASPDQVIVGEIAKQTGVMEPETTVSLVKSLIGRTDFAIEYNGEDQSPEQVSSYILRKVAEDAAAQINAEVKDVVITCPAYFGTAERTATRNAGIIAGLNVLEVVNEPTAAAIYYGSAKETGEKTVLVFDLGGGTFDVTIMDITEDKIEVVASEGNHELGGTDWDEAIINYLVAEFQKETDFDGEFDEFFYQDVSLKAEVAKQQLTAKEEVPVFLDAAGLRAGIKLSRSTFEDITSNLLNEAIKKTDAAIKIAQDKGYQVDEILMVGGSTKMPKVSEVLFETYNIEPQILEPDEAVAKGAAIHAVNVYVNNQKSLTEITDDPEAQAEKNKNLDAEDYKETLAVNPEIMSLGGQKREVVIATTKSFAIAAYNTDDELKCFNLITKNAPMPGGIIKSTETFQTRDENQREVAITVYENDYMDSQFDVNEDFHLGEATLELPDGLPQGSPLSVTFILNADGILEVIGVDETSKQEVTTTMQAQGIMAAEKVEELVEKSKHMNIM